MISLAEVLAFKFPNVEGIRTREKMDHPEPFDPLRDMEIFDWPTVAAGRGEPSRVELTKWRTEFDSLLVEKPLLTAEELAAQMIKDGTMTRAKIDAIKAAR